MHATMCMIMMYVLCTLARTRRKVWRPASGVWRLVCGLEASFSDSAVAQMSIDVVIETEHQLLKFRYFRATNLLVHTLFLCRPHALVMLFILELPVCTDPSSAGADCGME